MENAAKALIIAGGVLIAIMIISLGIYLFQSAGRLSVEYDEKLSTDAINIHNNKFLTYAKDINAQDMVTLINMIEENNSKNIYAPEMQITLIINQEEIDMSLINEEWKVNIMEKQQAREDDILSYNFLSVNYNSSGYINRMKYKTP